ncbi:protein SSUH2 homolog isoform X1 [Diadema antillarum]|uniref:protein SSUH2 homolog isoform X1 n=2 Tax=Diadema antillarum TaxID=105358 RepID=UPI003A877720
MADERQPMLSGQQNKMYSQAQGYPPQQPGYPPQQGQGYPPATPQGGYPPPAQGGYPPAQGGYPPAQGGYPPAQGGYQQQAPPQGGGGYPPPQGPPPGDAQGVDSPSFKGEVPDDDIEFDPNAASSGPPEPTAPPADKMDQVSGYNMMDAPLPPPPPPSYSEAVQPTREAVNQAPTLTDDEAREALLGYVAENCCRGKKAATEMKVNDLDHSAAFHYTLETFTEKRTTKWKHEPFTGQIIDGPHNGPAPQPWSIMVNIPAMFQNGKAKLEVPHTASVKPCHDCYAIGFRRCHHCMGRGRTRCHMCHGHGRRQVTHYNHEEHRHHSHWETCHSCHGMGRRRCFTCHGHGQITCTTCSGRANLKFYIQLTVDWTNHMNDSIVERTALPDELIRDVTGQVAFKEEQPRVFPVNHFPDQSINQASNTLVQQHSTAFQLERILQQRHQVRIIPVTEVKSTYGDKQFMFFVYGFEHKVYAPEYPMQCCCGCTIL